MKTNLQLTLLLVLIAAVAHTQPQSVGYLWEPGGILSAADVDGVLYFSSGKDLYRAAEDGSFVDYFAGLTYGSELTLLTNVNGMLYFVENRADASALWRVNEMDELPLKVIDPKWFKLLPSCTNTYATEVSSETAIHF